MEKTDFFTTSTGDLSRYTSIDLCSFFSKEKITRTLGYYDNDGGGNGEGEGHIMGEGHVGPTQSTCTFLVLSSQHSDDL